jgi:hypothetical protein
MKRQKDKNLHRKQQRRRKVRHLRQRIVQARDLRERERLIAKLRRISPRASIPST